MFNQHTSIFATFHPADSNAARRVIDQLARQFPTRTITGRHTVSSEEGAARAIANTTLTLILETNKTYTSPEVLHDIRLSLAKSPRNQILRISLDNEEAEPNSGTVTQLSEFGVERVLCDSPRIIDAIERLDLLSRYEPKLKLAVTPRAKSTHDCSR
jgi:hypothetical protein